MRTVSSTVGMQPGMQAMAALLLCLRCSPSSSRCEPHSSEAPLHTGVNGSDSLSFIHPLNARPRAHACGVHAMRRALQHAHGLPVTQLPTAPLLSLTPLTAMQRPSTASATPSQPGMGGGSSSRSPAAGSALAAVSSLGTQGGRASGGGAMGADRLGWVRNLVKYTETHPIFVPDDGRSAEVVAAAEGGFQKTVFPSARPSRREDAVLLQVRMHSDEPRTSRSPVSRAASVPPGARCCSCSCASRCSHLLDWTGRRLPA